MNPKQLHTYLTGPRIGLLLTISIAGLALWLLLDRLSLAAPGPRYRGQDAFPPIVTITQPTTNQVLTTTHQPAYPVQGRVEPGTIGSAPIAEVSLTLDSGLSYVPTSFTLPDWSYNWTLPSQVDWVQYTLQARARDIDGTVGRSTPVSVWVDTAPPHSVAITVPEPYFEEKPASFKVDWSASDGAGISTYDVEYRIDQGAWINWLGHTANTSGQFGEGGELDGVPEGSILSFRARARDTVGNLSSYSSPASTRLGPLVLYLPFAVRNYRTDTFEPNDRIDTAFGPLKAGVIYQSFIWSADDPDDFYYFELPQTRRVIITLGDIPSSVDYDLYIYDKGFNLVGASASAGASTEQVDKTLTAGTVYIRVFPYQGHDDTQPYSLQVNYP